VSKLVIFIGFVLFLAGCGPQEYAHYSTYDPATDPAPEPLYPKRTIEAYLTSHFLGMNHWEVAEPKLISRTQDTFIYEADVRVMPRPLNADDWGPFTPWSTHRFTIDGIVISVDPPIADPDRGS
jgi:hypothetical protein